MSSKPAAPAAHAADRLVLSEQTGQTDNQRIRDITPLPPPDHLIRFFPIAGTPAETLIAHTRPAVRQILAGNDDRMLAITRPGSGP